MQLGLKDIFSVFVGFQKEPLWSPAAGTAVGTGDVVENHKMIYNWCTFFILGKHCILMKPARRKGNDGENYFWMHQKVDQLQHYFFVSFLFAFHRTGHIYLICLAQAHLCFKAQSSEPGRIWLTVLLHQTQEFKDVKFKYYQLSFMYFQISVTNLKTVLVLVPLGKN